MFYFHIYKLKKLEKEQKQLEKNKRDKESKATKRVLQKKSALKTDLQMICDQLAKLPSIAGVEPGSDKYSVILDSLRNLLRNPQVYMSHILS